MHCEAEIGAISTVRKLVVGSFSRRGTANTQSANPVRTLVETSRMNVKRL